MDAIFSGDSDRLYIIGIDIPAARYRTDSGSGYWEIWTSLNSIGFRSTDLIANPHAGQTFFEIDLRFGYFGFRSLGFGTWNQTGPATTDLSVRTPEGVWRSMSRYPSRLRMLAPIRVIAGPELVLSVVSVQTPQIIQGDARPLKVRMPDASWRYILDFSSVENVDRPFYQPEESLWSETLTPYVVSVNNFSDDPFDESQGVLTEGTDNGPAIAQSYVKFQNDGFNSALQSRAIVSLGLGWIGWIRDTLLPPGTGVDLVISYFGGATWQQVSTTGITSTGGVSGKTLTVDRIDCSVGSIPWGGSSCTLHHYYPLSQGPIVGTVAEAPLDGPSGSFGSSITISLDDADFSIGSVLSMQFRVTPVLLSDFPSPDALGVRSTTATISASEFVFSVVPRL